MGKDSRPRKKARTSTSINAEPDTASNTTPTCVIDHSAFPHIMDMIFDAASPKSRWLLSRTCRALHERFKVDIGGHVAIARTRRYKDNPARVELWSYSGMPAVPIGNAAGSKNDKHVVAEGSSSVRRSSSAKKAVSITLHTPFLRTRPSRSQIRTWYDKVFTSDELAWFTKANITVLDIRDKSFPMAHQLTFARLVRPNILRCPTALYVAHFAPDAIVYPITMASSQNVDLPKSNFSPRTSKLVFALRYMTIPAAGTVMSHTYLGHDISAVIHVSATLDVGDENAASLSDKALNFENFKSVLESFCVWVNGDVTLVGLERVASSLFGVSTEGGNLAPAIIQQLAECHPNWHQRDLPNLRKRFDCRLKILSETEYLELHNMSPLMLAIMRGARYH